MNPCPCCQTLRQALQGPPEAYACESHTPTVNGKRFSIQRQKGENPPQRPPAQSRTPAYCRIDIDKLMPQDQIRCDYAFAQCPGAGTGAAPSENVGEWLFVELAGDAKDLQHCYQQLKASITFVRSRHSGCDPSKVEGYIIGGKPSGRATPKRDADRDLKHQFIAREKRGRLLHHTTDHSHTLAR